jgi:hypothetical protein
MLQNLKLFECKSRKFSQASVAHSYNPSYSGDRDQEDFGLKLALGKKFVRLYLKNTHHKKGLVEWFKW